MLNTIDRVQDYLSRRRNAYCKVFLNLDGLTPFGEIVLEDLAKFCRAHESTFNMDARAHAVAEGRREVWLRIQKHLRLSDEQLWSLYNVSQPTNQGRTSE